MSTDVARACRRKKLESVANGLVAPGVGGTWQDWDLACILARILGTGPHTSELVTPPYTTRWNPPVTSSGRRCPASTSSAVPAAPPGMPRSARTTTARRRPLLREWAPDGVAEVGWHEELPHTDGPTGSRARSWRAPSARSPMPTRGLTEEVRLGPHSPLAYRNEV